MTEEHLWNPGIADIIGIGAASYDESFLDRSLRKRMAEVACGSVEEYSHRLQNNEPERAVFVESLKISYSEFFRDPLTFAVLERILLPTLSLKKKNMRRELRIWSAACAGGQEAYSLAILLEELNSGKAEPFTYRIFATDQSDIQVDQALKGVYSEESLKNMSLKRLGEWFEKNGDNYTVKPKLKEHLDFSAFDLLRDESCSPPSSIFGDFDLIFCANILFYYSQEHRGLIIEKLRSSLAEGGYLVTGEAERVMVAIAGFNEIFPQSAVFKEGKPPYEV